MAIFVISFNSDQVKAAIKNGAIPCDCPIKWVVGCGPYFIIRAFRPYNENELTTHLHRPNDSGDWLMTNLNQEAQATARVKCIEEPVYLIGTLEAAVAASCSSSVFDGWHNVV